MKSELIHLLQKLKADHPDFQNLLIPHSGAPIFAVLQHTTRRFETLDALEAYAWPPEAGTNQAGTVAPRGPSIENSPLTTRH